MDAPTYARLRELLHYEPETGIFTWLPIPRNKAYLARGIAGSIHIGPRNGYRVIAIDWHDYQAHRLAWLYVHGVWPPAGQIDHINGVRDDNRIANLRIATPSQNKANQPVRRDSKTGIKGVRFDGRGRGRWHASITQHGKRKHLGFFATANEAHAAYRVASQKLYGEFGRAE